MSLEKRVNAVIAQWKLDYPDAECSLDYNKDYELLFSTRLAAQCTDARVNIVTETLYRDYPSLEAFAEADLEELERRLYSTGFFRAKARDLKKAARMLLDTYGGKVPDTMEELLKIPGVGRKTANLVLGDVFGKPAVVTDTHCIRITNLLGFTDSKDPLKVEKQLWKILPPEEANHFCHRTVLHGRAVCVARRPDCANCSIRPYCDHGMSL
ncbi:endonuclease III [Oscillospiraceae bacterium OttesenSCG-928-F05]|nr:endonuclease III [Oscillospiraceae bacterium OttesenSCG-928-F05]